MLSNSVWKVLTRQFLEPRFLVNYKSCWPATLQSCLAPLELSNAPKRTEIFNKVQGKFKCEGHGSLYINNLTHSDPLGSICKKAEELIFSEPWGLFSSNFWHFIANEVYFHTSKQKKLHDVPMRHCIFSCGDFDGCSLPRAWLIKCETQKPVPWGGVVI